MEELELEPLDFERDDVDLSLEEELLELDPDLVELRGRSGFVERERVEEEDRDRVELLRDRSGSADLERVEDDDLDLVVPLDRSGFVERDPVALRVDLSGRLAEDRLLVDSSDPDLLSGRTVLDRVAPLSGRTEELPLSAGVTSR